ncbi:MAG: hypothetical protein APF80_00645 [Alphaproteobacteria bacterium BRH_c36]|nr:MAG: hypothetical protein APF80_00645 [Alphaproteobacteria bacterium BRH_c36]
MFKFVAAAAVVAVAVSGMPTVSEAGHARDRSHDCRLCKAVSDVRARTIVRSERAPVVRREIVWPKFERKPRESLFKLAPRQPRPAMRLFTRERAPVARREFVWPKFERKPRESLFKLAPREPRPAMRLFTRERAPMVRRPIVWPKFERKARDPLFKLAPRQPRPAVAHVRSERVSVFTRRHRGTGTK